MAAEHGNSALQKMVRSRTFFVCECICPRQSRMRKCGNHCECSETGETSWELPEGVSMNEVQPFTADDERFLPDDDLEAHELALAVAEDDDANATPDRADGANSGAAAQAAAAEHKQGDEDPPVDEKLQAMVALFPPQLDSEYSVWLNGEGTCTVGPQSSGDADMWTAHNTESRGSSSGDVYYVHKSSGATVWDTPAGVVTPQQREQALDVSDVVQQAAEMAGEDGGAQEALEYIGIPNAQAWQTSCARLRAGDGDVTEAYKCLRAVLAVVTEAGEDEDWAHAAAAQEHAVIRSVVGCLQPAAPPILRTTAVQLLFILNQLLPATLQGTVQGSWGMGLKHVLAMSASGLWNAVMGCQYTSTTQMWPPRLGSSRRKSVSAWHVGAVDAEGAATWLMYAASVLHACKQHSVAPPRSSLCSLLAVLLDTTAVLPWTVQCRVAWTDAMGAVYNFADEEFDPILAVTVGDARGQAVADGLLAVLQNSTEFTEQGDLSAPTATIVSALQLLQHVLSRQATAAVVFAADLRVLVDIALRQLADEGSRTDSAAHWVCLLRLILLDGRLAQPGASRSVYRLEDIAAALEVLLDADDSESQDEGQDERLAEEITRLTQETAHLWE